jgi:hypothetical protein
VVLQVIIDIVAERTAYVIFTTLMMEAVIFSATQPNVMAVLVTFLVRIWEFPGSNLGPETGYPG